MVQIDRTGTADADPGNAVLSDVVLVEQTVDRRPDSVDSAVAPLAAAGLAATPADDFPIIVVGDRQHLRAAEVESNPDVFLICSH